MQHYSSFHKSRPRRVPKQPSEHTRVKTSCTGCRDKKLRCDRAKPCNSCCRRRITDECRYEDGHNDDARAHAVVRKALQERIEALENEIGEHQHRLAEQRNKISELVEANNRAADVFCQTTEIMASSGELAFASSPEPVRSSSSLPLRTPYRPALRTTSNSAPLQNHTWSSDISRCMVQNEIDKLRCLQQLVLLTARSIVTQASLVLDNDNASFDQVVLQQVCDAAVILGTSMCECGDFDSDRSLVEATLQSFQRLRSQHPSDPDLATAAAKLLGLLHLENSNEASRGPFLLSQAVSLDPCAAFIACPTAGVERMQQTRLPVMAGDVPSHQKASISSKPRTRRRQPVILKTYAMDIPNNAVLPDTTRHVAPSAAEPPTQAMPRVEILPARVPAPYRPILADPTLALMIAPEIHSESANSIKSRPYADRGLEESESVLQLAPLVTPYSAPATSMNQENIDAAPMTGHTDYLQYRPPMTPSYFVQETYHANISLDLSPAPCAQILACGSQPPQFT